MHRMRKAGMREVRQDLISLLDDVRKGREVVITDRGRPVARLVPVRSPRPFPDLKRVRASAGRLARARLSDALLADREDRV
jgi:prevent-host-death family protein